MTRENLVTAGLLILLVSLLQYSIVSDTVGTQRVFLLGVFLVIAGVNGVEGCPLIDRPVPEEVFEYQPEQPKNTPGPRRPARPREHGVLWVNHDLLLKTNWRWRP